jgi:dTDP-4-dehydrorhamnose reductase
MGKLSKPRLLIIGASGFLGQHISRKAASIFEVFEADLEAPIGQRGLAMDITSADSVNAGFRQAAPHATILLAAISDIDQCERRPEVAQAVNVCGAGHVANACARSGAKLVFTSSAAVFDGTRHGYSESDQPTPLSVYGITKAKAEDVILEKLPSALILRMALVIGFAEGTGTNAMLNKFAAKLRAGQPVSFPDYEYRNPIDAETLSCFLLELLNGGGAGGVFHVGASESISRFELGRRLAERMGLSSSLVEPQSKPLPGRAPRGLDHFLLTGRLRATCRTPVPSCGEIIERAIHGSPQSNS